MQAMCSLYQNVNVSTVQFVLVIFTYFFIHKHKICPSVTSLLPMKVLMVVLNMHKQNGKWQKVLNVQAKQTNIHRSVFCSVFSISHLILICQDIKLTVVTLSAPVAAA